ncbi:MAG: hypothetical protein LC117_02080 [Bacteroidia bacterium]|nr:hypothetical protein [Bacteroidia bacterium]MCZ2276704.1 hypothetical protein [Bacteroidia bacterium]
MKKVFLTFSFILFTFVSIAQEKEFLQVTTVESVVPGGLGRSRMITHKPDGSMDEIKLENFFSLAGINFGNIRLNDKIIADKIADLSREGWTLEHITPGVYGADKSTGIFITRYLFMRIKQ